MSSAPIVVLDACVLYPAPLRDLMMYLQINRLIQAKWSDRIHEEWIRSVLRERPDLSRQRLERTRSLMDKNARDANIADYQEIESGITGLPDPDDAHVVAVGVKSGASRIVTFNLKDFPSWLPEVHAISAVHPDVFLLGVLEENPQAFLNTLREHRANLINPPKTMEEYLDTLAGQRLVATIKAIRDLGEAI